MAYVAEQRIDVLDLTPTYLGALVQAGLLERASLSTVVVGGEAVDPALWRRLCAAPGLRVIDLYGPTEATVDAYGWEGAGRGRRTCCGNVRVYVLDAALRPVPPGVAASSTSPARAWPAATSTPALTAARFVADPFGAGRADVPHRRPGPVAADGRAGAARPGRRAGEDPRVPGRAGRDRGRRSPTTRRRAGRGRAAGRPAGRVRRRRRRPSSALRRRGCPRPMVPGARRHARRAAADRQRQARPRRAAGAAGRRRPVLGARRRRGPKPSGRSPSVFADCSGCRPSARTTTSSPSAATASCRSSWSAGARRRVCAHPAGRVPAPDRRRPGAPWPPGGGAAPRSRPRRRWGEVPLTPVARWLVGLDGADRTATTSRCACGCPPGATDEQVAATLRAVADRHDLLRARLAGTTPRHRLACPHGRRPEPPRGAAATAGCREEPPLTSGRRRGGAADGRPRSSRSPPGTSTAATPLVPTGRVRAAGDSCCSSRTTWWSTASPGGSCSTTSPPAWAGRELPAGADLVPHLGARAARAGGVAAHRSRRCRTGPPRARGRRLGRRPLDPRARHRRDHAGAHGRRCRRHARRRC